VAVGRHSKENDAPGMGDVCVSSRFPDPARPRRRLCSALPDPGGPERASEIGDTRYNDRWTDRSLAAILARQAADRAALERLRAIDRAALAADQQLNYDCAREPNPRWVPDSICVTTMTRRSRLVPSP